MPEHSCAAAAEGQLTNRGRGPRLPLEPQASAARISSRPSTSWSADATGSERQCPDSRASCRQWGRAWAAECCPYPWCCRSHLEPPSRDRSQHCEKKEQRLRTTTWWGSVLKTWCFMHDTVIVRPDIALVLFKCKEARSFMKRLDLLFSNRFPFAFSDGSQPKQISIGRDSWIEACEIDSRTLMQ